MIQRVLDLMALPACSSLEEGEQVIQQSLKAYPWQVQSIHQYIEIAIDDVVEENEYNKMSSSGHSDFMPSDEASSRNQLVQDMSFANILVFRFRGAGG